MNSRCVIGAARLPVRAYDTLRTGCSFVARHAGERPMAAQGWAQIAHVRMFGNRLRELDRFLAVMIEDVAAGSGRPGHDRKAFGRLHNTAHKLGIVERMFGAVSQDHIRLRAIGRVAACLHHCAGQVHLSSTHDDVVLARGGGGDATPIEAHGKLRLDRETMTAISSFYREIGDRLWILAHVNGAKLDFPALSAHIGTANVACDGI